MQISQYAGTWRDANQDVVATVYGGTQCQAPRDPRSLAAVTADGGYEAILRCRDCEGCRRYEKLLLQRRLAEHFKDHEGELWALTLTGPVEFENPLKLPSSLTRWLPACVGMIRRGLHGLVLIVAGSRPPRRAPSSPPGWRLTVEKLMASRGARAFAKCASGLMIPREQYGRQTNRWYVRGLKPLPKETFIVQRQGGIRKRHPEAKGGLRAWRDGFTLYASQKTNVIEWLKAMRSWRSQRLDRSSLTRGRAGGAPSSASQATDKFAAPASPRDSSILPRGDQDSRRPVAASSLPRDQTEISQAGRDASSQSGLPTWAADFVARMTALARKRGP